MVPAKMAKLGPELTGGHITQAFSKQDVTPGMESLLFSADPKLSLTPNFSWVGGVPGGCWQPFSGFWLRLKARPPAEPKPLKWLESPLHRGHPTEVELKLGC